MGIGTGIGTGIGITEEHRALAHSVRGWLARAAPPGEVRKLLDAHGPAALGARPAHWEALAAQGLTGIHLPEAYGGGGGDLLDLAVVLEEAAYGSLPGPYLATALVGTVLRRVVSPGTGDLLRALAAGDRTAAFALTPGTLTATPAPGGHRLDGTAPPVLTGEAADLLLLPAADASGGVLWFLVDAGAEGIAVRPHRSVDPTRPTAEVRADAVPVPAHRVLPLDSALVADLAAVLLAADACGSAARSLDTAVEHATVREQFGRPIGAFQAVKHLCADMLVRLEQARALTWDAARAADEAVRAAEKAGAAGSGGESARPDVAGPGVRGLAAALAAATAPEAAYTCAKDAIQILGGIGFTWEHDAHLQLRRAVLARQLLGTADTHRLRAARLAEAGARRELALELPAEAAYHRAEARPHLAAARGLTPAGARRALASTPATRPRTSPPRTDWTRGPYDNWRSSRSRGNRASASAICPSPPGWCRPSSSTEPRSSGSAICRPPCAATSSGASSSRNPTPDPTSPRCAPARYGPTRDGGSPGRRSGRAPPAPPTTASCWPAPTRTPPSTADSPTSWST